MVLASISGWVLSGTAQATFGDLTFGRNAAEFRLLIEWLAITSLVLWAVVLATVLVRLVVCHVWFRYLERRNNPPI